jgi:hypothetical protein
MVADCYDDSFMNLYNLLKQVEKVGPGDIFTLL